MIRMVDHDGDGQVCFEEFFKMVTGKKPPPQFGGRGKYGKQTKAQIQSNNSFEIMNGANSTTPKSNANDNANANSNVSPIPPTGQAVVQARNTKRKSLDEFARDNHLKPESIKRAHRRFQAVDKKKSGVMDYTEFCEIFQVEPTPQSEDLFRLYDYKKSGLVDAKEVMIAMTNFTGAGKEDKLKFAFMLFDEEANGAITKEELIKVLKANHMAKVDAEVHRKAETIMAQADKHGDGVITFDDFVAVSKKFPNILFPAHNNVKK